MTLRGIPVLHYDGLGTSPPPDVNARLASRWVTPVSLGWQLVSIRECGHRVVRLYDAWARRDDGDQPGHTPVVLTFDEGRAADYEVAFPLLLAAGVRAEFFINTSRVGQPGYLTWNRISEMQRAAMSFQSHSHSHGPLTALPPQLLRNEVRTSKRVIEDHTGRGVNFLAAPFGLVDRRVIDEVREAGYKAVCASGGWPAQPRGAVVNRVTVLRDTSETQFGAILAREPRGYLPGVARALRMRLLHRVALKLRPPGLDGQVWPQR